jgi:hypothetical protein
MDAGGADESFLMLRIVRVWPLPLVQLTKSGPLLNHLSVEGLTVHAGR